LAAAVSVSALLTRRFCTFSTGAETVYGFQVF